MSRPSSKLAKLQRLLIPAGILAVVFIAGSAWLFSGSVVFCDELEGEDGGPSLHCAFDIAAPIEDVWDGFTRVGEPRRHYFDAILQAEMRPGGRWRFVTDDGKRFLAGGEVLALDPPRRFEQTFAAADLDDPPSRITVALEPTADGSRVVLVHDRFPGETVTYRRFRRAHPLALSALKSLLETGELPVRARIYTALFKPGMKTFGVRAEPWE